MAKVGRPSTKIFKTPDGKVITSCYCRRCQQDLNPRNFYEATDEILDTNGFMSVCKDCISDLFMNAFKIESSLEKAILSICRIMNVAYVPEAVSSVRTWIDKKMKDSSDYSGAFGFYKAKVGVFARMNPIQQKHFIEPSSDLFDDDIEDVGEENYDLVEFWGAGLSYEEYEFLEKELANFKKTHKSDTHSELVLLKEVCFVMLDIQKARKSNKSTASLVKSLQEIMKSLAISPNMANASTASKSTEAFGLWIKDIEELEPAEWHQDNTIYKDMDNLDFYFQNYFVRPIRNFITGSRDFNITEMDGDVDIELSDADYDYLDDED